MFVFFNFQPTPSVQKSAQRATTTKNEQLFLSKAGEDADDSCTEATTSTHVQMIDSSFFSYSAGRRRNKKLL